MWLNPKPNVALWCVSTNNQITQSNVGPPYILRLKMTIFNQNGHFRLKTGPISLQIVILEQKWPNSSKISLLYSPGPIRRTRISINIQESVLNVAGEKFEASGGKKVGNRHVAIFRACIWFTWLHLDTLNRKLNYETLEFRIYRSNQIFKRKRLFEIIRSGLDVLLIMADFQTELLVI